MPKDFIYMYIAHADEGLINVLLCACMLSIYLHSSQTEECIFTFAPAICGNCFYLQSP